jgi:competence ComEA-like helix-hairpin-helix protein
MGSNLSKSERGRQSAVRLAANLVAALAFISLVVWLRTVPAPDPNVRIDVGESAGPDMRLDLNRASAAELELLPGVGPSLAERIVAYRTEHGPFDSVEAVDAVRGVGPRIVDSMRPFVVVE